MYELTQRINEAKNISMMDEETGELVEVNSEEVASVMNNEISNELRNRGCNENIIKSIDEYVRVANTSGSALSLADVLSKVGSEILNNEDKMSRLLESVKEIVQRKMRNKEMVEDIMQVPLAFRVSTERNRGVRNEALKDQELRAEVNSYCGGLCDRIMSGNLTIDIDTLDELWTVIDLSKSKITEEAIDYNKKMSLNIASYILNDAMVVQEISRTDSDIWTNFRRHILKMNSKRTSPVKHKATVIPGRSIMRYRVLGMQFNNV
jgi:hypothetical protein